MLSFGAISVARKSANLAMSIFAVKLAPSPCDQKPEKLILASEKPICSTPLSRNQK